MNKKIFIAIFAILILAASVFADEREDFEKNPTPENFNKLVNPTAEDLKKVINPTIQNFGKLSEIERRSYLKTNYKPEFASFAQKYLKDIKDFTNAEDVEIAKKFMKDSDFSTADDKGIAEKFFSGKDTKNLNDNKDIFINYQKSKGVDISFDPGGLISSYENGLLKGKDGNPVSIEQLKDAFTFKVDKDGNLILKPKNMPGVEQQSAKTEITKEEDGSISFKPMAGEKDAATTLKFPGGDIKVKGDFKITPDGKLIGEDINVLETKAGKSYSFEGKLEVNLDKNGEIEKASLLDKDSVFKEYTVSAGAADKLKWELKYNGDSLDIYPNKKVSEGGDGFFSSEGVLIGAGIAEVNGRKVVLNKLEQGFAPGIAKISDDGKTIKVGILPEGRGNILQLGQPVYQVYANGQEIIGRIWTNQPKISVKHGESLIDQGVTLVETLEKYTGRNLEVQGREESQIHLMGDNGQYANINKIGDDFKFISANLEKTNEIREKSRQMRRGIDPTKDKIYSGAALNLLAERYLESGNDDFALFETGEGREKFKVLKYRLGRGTEYIPDPFVSEENVNKAVTTAKGIIESRKTVAAAYIPEMPAENMGIEKSGNNILFTGESESRAKLVYGQISGDNPKSVGLVEAERTFDSSADNVVVKEDYGIGDIFTKILPKASLISDYFSLEGLKPYLPLLQWTFEDPSKTADGSTIGVLTKDGEVPIRQLAPKIEQKYGGEPAFVDSRVENELGKLDQGEIEGVKNVLKKTANAEAMQKPPQKAVAAKITTPAKPVAVQKPKTFDDVLDSLNNNRINRGNIADYAAIIQATPYKSLPSDFKKVGKTEYKVMQAANNEESLRILGLLKNVKDTYKVIGWGVWFHPSYKEFNDYIQQLGKEKGIIAEQPAEGRREARKR